MRPGEVWRIAYPESDGHEQAGGRPGLVLQDEAFAGGSPLVLTVPFSTSARVGRFPAVVPIPAATENGLTADSSLLVFQIRATDRVRVGGRLGAITPAQLQAVYDALDRLTGRGRLA